MTTRFLDHVLGPDTHANRPPASGAGAAPYGAMYVCSDHDLIYRNDEGTWIDWAVVGGGGGVDEYLLVALSDETTDITTGVKITLRMPFALTLTGVRASLADASSAGGPVTVDIKEGGVSILSTLLTIDDGETTSTTAATPVVISDPALADDAEITMEVTDAGTDAKGLKVTLIGTR